MYFKKLSVFLLYRRKIWIGHELEFVHIKVLLHCRRNRYASLRRYWLLAASTSTIIYWSSIMTAETNSYLICCQFLKRKPGSNSMCHTKLAWLTWQWNRQAGMDGLCGKLQEKRDVRLVLNWHFCPECLTAARAQGALVGTFVPGGRPT